MLLFVYVHATGDLESLAPVAKVQYSYWTSGCSRVLHAYF